MSLPITLPAWLPWWLPLLILLPAGLYLLVFLLMPFSVFGLKGRLDAIEIRLDEIQQDLRALVERLPAAVAAARYAEESYVETLPGAPQHPASPRGPMAAPPAAPAAVPLRAARPAAREREAPPARQEPRLDWPR
ncbi:MAG: hypothetical protein ACP5NI_10135 [Acetobacteraceae bacterium]